MCAECGADMWDNEIEGKFKIWLAGLTAKQKVQFKVSDHADRCLSKLMELFPNVKKAAFIRNLILVFMNLVNQPEHSKVLNEAFQSDYFLGFEQRPHTHMFACMVTPSFYFDLVTWANIYGEKPNQMASDAFHIMLSIFIAEDDGLKTFWAEEILPELQNLLLKAS